MSRVRLARVFWIGAAAILVAAALVAVAAIIRGDFSENDARVLVTLAALLYTGGAALLGIALGERGPARWLGRTIAAAAPVCLAFVLWGVWEIAFDGEGDYDATRAAWSAALALLAGIVATSGLLLARGRFPIGLIWAATLLAAAASTLSVIGVWTEPDDEAYVQVLAVIWILAGLCYFLAPVLQRFTAVGATRQERVLAELDGVELVATRSSNALDVRLARGERLALRRRP